MENVEVGLARSRLHQRMVQDSLIGQGEDDHDNPKNVRFTPFTAESYQQLLLWEAVEKHKELERKERSQEAHLKDGELKFGDHESDDKVYRRNPDLEEGNALKPEYGEPPAYYLGLPLEEIDKGINAKTFIVLSRWLNHIQISRFSATPSFFILSATSPLRRLAIFLCTNQIFDFFILFIIITNCICLAIPEANNLAWLEYVFFGIYSTEMVIQIVARGLLFCSYTYLRDPWNWLDMIVVASGIPSIILKTDGSEDLTSSRASATQALRTFRVLRAVKTISIFPGLRTIVNAMLRAIKMLMEVVLLTIFCLLVFSLVSVQIYKGTLRQKCVIDPMHLTHKQNSWESYPVFYQRMLRDPGNWENRSKYILCGNTTGAGRCQKAFTCQGNIGENPNFGFMNFDNVYSSVLIMFQLMTIDFWENAYRKVLLTNGYLAVIFFILTVFFGSFYLLNLMLAVVTITYQEEAEKTHQEMESEKAAKKQRKQAVNAFYNMTTLATKQNVWAKLIHENKQKEKDRESPLQKLVRLRTAINVWKKFGKNLRKSVVDISVAKNFVEYATADRTALDVLQNVAYFFKKWEAKTFNGERHLHKKLRFDVLHPYGTPSTSSTPVTTHRHSIQESTLIARNATLITQDKTARATTSFDSFHRVSGFRNGLKSIASLPRRFSELTHRRIESMRRVSTIVAAQIEQEEELPEVSEGKLDIEVKDVSQNQNQAGSEAGCHVEDEEHSHLINSQATTSLDFNANAPSGSPTSCHPSDQQDQVDADDWSRRTDNSCPSSAVTSKSGTSVNEPIKVFKSFSQVGRQLLISAVSNMDYKPTRISYAAETPFHSSKGLVTPLHSPWWTPQGSSATRRPRHCAPAIYCIKRAGSRVRHMIHDLVSDIFFDMLINFCIVLNTILMSLEYHGMTALMKFFIRTSGQVFTLMFDVEALLKIISFGCRGYFGSRWNRFDFIIALLSTVSIGLELSGLKITKGLQFLRSFRLLRALKLAQVWPAMHNLLCIIGNALSALGQLTIILGIILYIFAIIGLQLFKDKYNELQFPNGVPRWNFKDFFHSFMMMFRVLCGEWIEPLWDCMRMKEVHDGVCMIVFLPTLIFGNFVVLNLFLALLLNAFGENPTTGTETPQTRRLREAKMRFKAKFTGLFSSCFGQKEVRLIIHRPNHLTSSEQPEVPKSKSDNTVRIFEGSTEPSPQAMWKLRGETVAEGPPSTLSPGKIRTTPATSLERSTMSTGTSNAIYISLIKTKARRGAARTQDLIQVKQVAPPVRDLGAPPCFPKCLLNKAYGTRERFNRSAYGKKWMAFRTAVMKRVQSDLFEYVVLFFIIMSSVMLAFEDYDYQRTLESPLRTFINYANHLFIVLFTTEMVLRWIAFGVTKYFTNVWTVIDFVVVVVSVMAVLDREGEEPFQVFYDLKTSHLSDLNVFRALRAFRPLRVVSRIQGMKIVVNSLMRAIPAILNVFMVSLLFWLIFCVMGVQFFRGKFYKCIDKATGNRAPNIKTRVQCEQNPQYVWFNSYINFDNVANGFLALFQVATFEGWMEIMTDAIDSTEVDQQPKLEGSLYTYLYFVAFIICGSFFSLNLVIGVIIDNFNVLKKKYEGSYLDGFLTPTQRNYYNTLKKMSTRKPQRIITPPRTRFQLIFYNLSTSDRFELLLMVVVFFNMIVQGVEYSQYKLPCVWYEVLWVLDIGFCVFFIIEAILKIVGLRLYYFTLPWNCFDFIVAVLSFLDVGVHLIHQYKGLKTPQRLGDEAYVTEIRNLLILSPMFLRLLRIFRISRVLRIIKVAKGLRKVIFSLVISLPAIINIMALLMLCLYIYAIFGMFLFSYVKLSGALTQMMNFRSFKNSALLLLSLSTAAGWNDILDPLLIAPPFCNTTHHKQDDGNFVAISGGDCGKVYLATPYMVSYIILTYLFIINMYIAVILENYHQAHQQEEVGVTEDDFDMFYSVWQRYDPHATQYIQYTQLSDFVADLDSPLGIPKPNEIALVSINLPILQGDRIHCLDILLGLIRNVLTDVDESDEIFTLKQQINTKFRARFPSRTKMKMISTTIERKKEDVAARTLQRAWQVFKTQQADLKHPCQSSYPSWSEQRMTAAVKAVKEEGMHVWIAANQFLVPRPLLQRRIGNSRFPTGLNPYFNRPPILSKEQEEYLGDLILDVEHMLFGLSKRAAQELAFHVASRKSATLANIFNEQRKREGKNWFLNFLKKNPQLISKPEAKRIVSESSFSESVVKRFYEILKSVLENYKLDAQSIYNMDEACLNIAVTDKYQPESTKRTGRDMSITMVSCFNASGFYVPPFVIFKGEKMKEHLKVGAPAGTGFAVHENGWLDEEIFYQWLVHFTLAVRPSKKKPVLLLIDEHVSHTGNNQAIKRAQLSGIILMSIPPQCSDHLQDLHPSYFKHLSTYVSRAAEQLMMKSSSNCIQSGDVCKVLGEAFARASLVTFAEEAFDKAGIWPPKRDVFSDANWIAAIAARKKHIPLLLSDSFDQELVPATVDVEDHQMRTSEPDQISLHLMQPAGSRPVQEDTATSSQNKEPAATQNESVSQGMKRESESTVKGNGRCFFHSVALCIDPSLKKTKQSNDGKSPSLSPEEQEKSLADIMRFAVISFMAGQSEQLNSLLGPALSSILNDDMSGNRRSISLDERLKYISNPKSSVGELEIAATAKFLKKTIIVVNAEFDQIKAYNDVHDRDPGHCIVVAFHQMANNVGHFNPIVVGDPSAAISEKKGTIPVSGASDNGVPPEPDIHSPYMNILGLLSLGGRSPEVMQHKCKCQRAELITPRLKKQELPEKGMSKADIKNLSTKGPKTKKTSTAKSNTPNVKDTQKDPEKVNKDQAAKTADTVV